MNPMLSQLELRKIFVTSSRAEGRQLPKHRLLQLFVWYDDADELWVPPVAGLLHWLGRSFGLPPFVSDVAQKDKRSTARTKISVDKYRRS
jgi:hypothetical protein